jgi:hypothetical protein
MPFVDVRGISGAGLFMQIVSAVPKLKSGITVGVTVTAKVAPIAHWPAVGVNVYVPEAWLSIIEGLHVPLMLLPDIVGNEGTPVPEHTVNEVPNANVGVMLGVTVTVNVVVVAHNPAVGVNV